MTQSPIARLPNDCFALPPGVEWTPVDTALARLEERLAPVTAVETVALSAAGGRILASDVAARRSHPAADNAAVDGYAFAHPGLGPDGERPTLTFDRAPGRAAAGAPHAEAVPAGAALRILTGAAMPTGTDTVVLEEDVEATPDGRLRFPAPRKPGANRRRAGENLSEGGLALSAGQVLSPQALAQAAAAGLAALPVRRPLRVALMSTGDELVSVEAAEAARPDQVIDSNRPMLAGLAAAAGVQVLDLGQIPDDRSAVEAALDRGAAEADAIIASGGASAGDEDHVSAALAAGDETGEGGFHLWRIAMKPGRPLALGMRRGAPVFGLPGNPVAAFVCFCIFVRPALHRLAGAPWSQPAPLTAPAGFDHGKKPGRREYLRVRLRPDGALEKFRSEGSGLIEGLVWADGLADLAEDAGPVRAGDPVRYLPFSAFGVGR